MKRLKALASCCIAAACLTITLGGCSSQQSYTPPEKTPTLSTPTIGKDGTLRVGVNAAAPPLAGQSSSSSLTKTVGIDVDIAAALADILGLKLDVVDVGTDPEGALADDKVDIVMGVDQSDSDLTFWKSSPYLPTGVALFAASMNTAVPSDTSAPSIAAQVSSTSSWEVTNEFGEDALVAVEDLKSAFSTLDAQEVGYVAADAIRGSYVVHSEGYDAAIVALMQTPGGYCVGVLDTNDDLKQAVSDALATLTGSGIVSVIETKWLGAPLDLTNVALTEGTENSSTSETSDGETTSLDDADTSTQAAASTGVSTTNSASDADEDSQGDEGSQDSDVANQAGSNAVQPSVALE